MSQVFHRSYPISHNLLTELGNVEQMVPQSENIEVMQAGYGHVRGHIGGEVAKPVWYQTFTAIRTRLPYAMNVYGGKNP